MNAITHGFPRWTFGLAVILTIAALGWLGSIAGEAFRDAAASRDRLRVLDGVADRISRSADAELDAVLAEALHALASADEVEPAVELPAIGGAPRREERSLPVEPIRAAVDRARETLAARATRERDRGLSHVLGSVVVLGSVALVWLGLTIRLERSRRALVREVAERTRAAEALERATQELAKARDAALASTRLKTAFLSNLGHEIRTPLSIVLGYATAIADHARASGDEDLRSLPGKIERAGQKLTQLIEGILDLAMLLTGEFEVRREKLSVADVVRELGRRYEAEAREKGLVFLSAIEEPGAVVWFDDRCLRRALDRLLENAVKFTERGEVSVRLYRGTDGALRLELRDTGVGIGKEYLSRMFEPFSQEDAGRARSFEGAGIGLALARAYVTRNGAALEVQSEKGKGSTFTIVFSSVTD